MKYILQVLISFLFFFWIERVFYEGRYIKDLMHAKRKVNSFAPITFAGIKGMSPKTPTRETDTDLERERVEKKRYYLYIVFCHRQKRREMGVTQP